MKYNYWLYLEPYVYVSIKKENILLYNTINGTSIEYIGNAIISKLIKRLNRKDNLYVIGLTDSDLSNPVISNFIRKLKKYFSGDIIYSKASDGKPIQFKPIVNIQKSKDFLKKSVNVNVGRNMMRNLSEITIYINGQCELNCKACSDIYKQFKFCTTDSNKNDELDMSHIKEILNDISGTSVQKINILGGNISNYTELDSLITELKIHLPITEFYFHYKNIDIYSFNWYNKNSSLNILVTSSIDKNKLVEINNFIIKNEIKYIFTFIIENNKDLYNVELLISELKISQYSLSPYYNGKNISFFKKNVFLSKEDIIEAKPNQDNIFIRQNLNQNDFGKLIITNEGFIYSNINNNHLGNIKKISIYDAVYKEMNTGKSWFKLRSNIKPCSGCLYNALCPPISNYEYSIGKYNLCNIM